MLLAVADKKDVIQRHLGYQAPVVMEDTPDLSVILDIQNREQSRLSNEPPYSGSAKNPEPGLIRGGLETPPRKPPPPIPHV